MPELPEVETVRQGLNPHMAGRGFARVRVRNRNLRKPLPRGFAAALEGARVRELARRGKYLLVRLDDGRTLLIHLGMSGRMAIHSGVAPSVAKHDHVIFEMTAKKGKPGATLVYNDTRRFGLMDLIEAGGEETHPLLAHLGPEPLSAAFSPTALACALKGKKVSIKAALMDQRVVAGLGNIYVSEALFRAGISPKRLAGKVAAKKVAELVRAVRAVLRAAIRAGGSTLRDHRQPDGNLGYFQHRFAVYDRAGLACPGCTCDVAKTGGIRRLVQQGRSTFYCPCRQR